MKTLALILSTLGLLSAALFFGQARPEFEVASIKPAMPLTPDVNMGLHVDGAQIHATYLSIKDLLVIAYPVRFDQILGPDWLPSERFDIAAKLPEGATRSQIPAMLQSMLQTRFLMKAHRDKKEFPIYSLQIAKGGSALKEVADAEGPLDYGTGNLTREGTATFNFGSGSMLIFGDNKIESRQLPLSIFADTLGRYMDRPVVDMTELKGRYNFVLNLTPGDFLAMRILSAVSAGVPLAPQVLRSLDGASFGSLSNALEKIGLRFQSAKAPLDVLVIDSIQKRPTDN